MNFCQQIMMRKINQEITDPQILEEILTGSTICHMAMTDHGQPYMLPFNYGYSGGCIYIHTAKEGKKLDVLRENPEVCFGITHTAQVVQAESPCKWATRYRSVIGYGRVEILTAMDEKQKGLEIIMKHHGATPPFDFESKQVESVLVLRLKIERMTGKESSNWSIGSEH